MIHFVNGSTMIVDDSELVGVRTVVSKAGDWIVPSSAEMRGEDMRLWTDLLEDAEEPIALDHHAFRTFEEAERAWQYLKPVDIEGLQASRRRTKEWLSSIGVAWRDPDGCVVQDTESMVQAMREAYIKFEPEVPTTTEVIEALRESLRNTLISGLEENMYAIENVYDKELTDFFDEFQKGDG